LAHVFFVHVTTPHVPPSAPGSLLHVSPEQQSLAVVQLPPDPTHAGWQRRTPLPSGAHGFPQQSAEEAHCVPAGGGLVQSPTLIIRQRGILSESRWQHSSGWLLHVPFFNPGGSQQLLLTLHELEPPTLQVWPAALHALPFEHRPYLSEELVFEHGTPQQSLSFWQSSPVGWQPDGFWQTFSPFCPPVGPQAREQHDASHCTLPLGHNVPETLHCPAPVPPAAWQVPFAFVPVFVQLPLQHWPSWKQMSPSCVQYETADAHTPVWHRPEQQSVFTEQPLPDVRHVPPGLIGAHLFPVQMPLQHCGPDVHDAATGLSGRHAEDAHF
jgi:hypothetical protein